MAEMLSEGQSLNMTLGGLPHTQPSTKGEKGKEMQGSDLQTRTDIPSPPAPRVKEDFIRGHRGIMYRRLFPRVPSVFTFPVCTPS